MVEEVNLNQYKIKIKYFKFGKYSFSSIELKHLFFAMIMIILTLFAFEKKDLIFKGAFFSKDFLIYFGMYFFTVGFAFILHELGHKFTAQHFGYISEFRADFTMLILVFLIALFSPFILIAPGAVYILGNVSKRENGIISLAGPLVNLFLSLFFLFGLVFFKFNNVYILNTFVLGFYVNIFIGLFNLLPLRWLNLDGYKILDWSKPVYFTVVSIFLFLLFIYIKFLSL
jgi:hypothetical protein